MSHKIQFVMVGGFLGAGKTTTIGRIASSYMKQGKKVGIVTNDQATDLVDTRTLESQGFDVGEVAGACFCCQFDSLMETISSLSQKELPDVILAEPVGSCTDLVATVIQPIRHLFEAEFSIAPYSVILKPGHGKRILQNMKKAGFSPKASYILKKQLEEADLILINRIDELSPEELNEINELIDQNYPNRPVLNISARTGEGFEQYLEMLDQQGNYGSRILEIDYDIYAEGEAELGWLNSSLNLSSDQSFSLDDVLLKIVTGLQKSLNATSSEIAHLKVIGLHEGYFGVANLISGDHPPELSLPSDCEVKQVDLIVNARVACDPEILEREVKNIISQISKEKNAEATFRNSHCFRPGRPVPTHRYESPAGL